MGLRNSESPSPAGKSVDAFQSLSRLATKARYITRHGRFCLCECAYILSSVSRPFLFLRNAETIGNKKRSWSTIGKGFISIISILWNHYIFADSSFVIIFCITPKFQITFQKTVSFNPIYQSCIAATILMKGNFITKDFLCCLFSANVFRASE